MNLRQLIRLIPNSLTMMRVAIALYFPFSSQDLWLHLVLAALVTEFLDGFLARRWDVCSDFGRLSDPVADKLFVSIVVASLFWVGRLTWYEVILVGARDLTVFLAIVILWFRNQKSSIRNMRPRWSGKITTALQFALLIGLIVWPQNVAPLLWLTVALSFWSGIDYIRNWKSNKQPAA